MARMRPNTPALRKSCTSIEGRVPSAAGEPGVGTVTVQVQEGESSVRTLESSNDGTFVSMGLARRMS
jgi:hypothetical protein